MKKNFSTLLSKRQKGFITLPFLIIAILGTLVVGGGGYAVYKVNQIEQESSSRVTELERKFEEVSKMDTATAGIALSGTTTTEEIATSTGEVIMAEETETVLPTIANIPAPSVQMPAIQLPVDVCTNLSGAQATLPDGYTLSGSNCIIKEDKCLNIIGIQEAPPSGMILTKEYGCISERELDQIEEAESELRQADGEAQQLAEECDILKKSVYEMDQEMLDIQKKYLNIIANGGPTGISRQFAEDWEQSQKNQMYSEIEEVELDRNKLANEYNYKCVY